MSVFFSCWTTSRWRIFIGSSFRVLIPDRIAHGCFECAFRSSDLRSRRSITMCLWSVKIPAVLSFLQVNLLFFVNFSISFCCFRIFSSKSRSYGSEICHSRACSSIEFLRSLFVSLTFVASLDCLSRAFFFKLLNWLFFKAIFMLFCFCLYWCYASLGFLDYCTKKTPPFTM